MGSHNNHGRVHRLQSGSLAAFIVITAAGCAESTSPPIFSPDEIAQASSYQQEIIADGQVTWAEYESSVIAQRDCVAAAGYTPGPIERVGSRLDFITDVDYTAEADPEAAFERFEDSFVACEREYVDMVGTIWAESLVIDDPQARDGLVASLVTCLADNGVPLDAGADFDDAIDALADEQLEMNPGISSCLDSHDRLFYVSITDDK